MITVFALKVVGDENPTNSADIADWLFSNQLHTQYVVINNIFFE